MHYLLFNNKILISDGQAVEIIEVGPALMDKDFEKVRICCVDVDVMVASAPQDHLDQKDSLLSQKFAAAYSDQYITLNEKIDSNIFQVAGIKAAKIKEIYSLVPSSKVDAFVPYAIAVRSFLVDKKINMKKLIIFVDDLGHEKFMTVFDGLKFSRTRTIYSDRAEDILPDIKRSSIDFNKKLGEFSNKSVSGEFAIFINNKQMAQDIQSLEPQVQVQYLDCHYPALEGLKSIDSQIKYRIPEEIILERKKKELRARLMHLVFAVGICLAGALFFGVNMGLHSFVSRDFKEEKLKNSQLKDVLNRLDRQIYRDSLRKSKDLDYSSAFFEVSGLLPGTYEISSFKFTFLEGHWILYAYLFAQDGQFYDEIPRAKALKNAEIKDSFIKNRPGKYLKVVL